MVAVSHSLALHTPRVPIHRVPMYRADGNNLQPREHRLWTPSRDVLCRFRGTCDWSMLQQLVLMLEKCLVVDSINKKKNVVKDVAELIANIDEELVDDEILVEL